MKLVTAEKRQRIKKYLRLEDAQRSLVADVLARQMLCEQLKASNKDLHFDTNAYGKPILRDVEHVHFNVSHSGDWVVAAVNHLPVGIDVEHIQHIDLGIAERFFSPAESVDLFRQPIKQRQTYFYSIWTLKESYIKAVGMGLSIPLDHFSIRDLGDAFELISEQYPTSFTFKQYEIDAHYKCSVCASEANLGDFPRTINVIDLNEWVDAITNRL
ncbi:4'-phosphopantetheinyl transferase superfamily protein [Paenibacillus sp. 481]|nr:4'-phosphopantetheinyl transferase superfamily protein [Paenibacillus sp. 481]